MNVLWRSLARMSAKLIFLLSVAGCFGTLAYAGEGIITTATLSSIEEQARSFYESVNKTNQEREHGITGRQSRNARDSSTSVVGDFSVGTDGLIADYRFDGNAEDMTGNNLPMTLENTQFIDNSLYLNGIYGYGSSGSDGYVATAEINKLSYNHFSISVDFYSLGQTPDNLGEEPEGTQINVITGGTSYRWFGLRYSNVTSSNSHLELTLNNGDYVHTFGQVSFEPNKWHSVIVSVDLENRTISTLFDGNQLDNIILDEGFSLRVVGSTSEESDKAITFTNYSNGVVFYGYIDNLKVFGRALSVSEMKTVGQANTHSLPTLGLGKAINNTGFINTAATFTGGASVDGVNYQSLLQTTASSGVSIQGSIQVSPSDVGKQADLLVVIGVEPGEPFDGGVDTVYRTLDELGNLSTVDLYNMPTVWMNQLTAHPFKRNVNLTADIPVNIGALGLNAGSNMSYIFIGYRLMDGSVVYNALPIMVMKKSTAVEPTKPVDVTNSLTLPDLVNYTFASQETKVLPGKSTEKLSGYAACDGVIADNDQIGRLALVALFSQNWCYTDGRYNHNDYSVERGGVSDNKNQLQLEAYRIHEPTRKATEFLGSQHAVYYRFPTQEDYTVYLFDGNAINKVAQVSASQIDTNQLVKVDSLTVSNIKDSATYLFVPSSQRVSTFTELAPNIEGAQVNRTTLGDILKYRYTVNGKLFDTKSDFNYGPNTNKNVYSQTRQFFLVSKSNGQLGIIWQDKDDASIQVTWLGSQLNSQETLKLPFSPDTDLAAATADRNGNLYYLAIQRGSGVNSGGNDIARIATLYKADMTGQELARKTLDTSATGLNMVTFGDSNVASLQYLDGKLGLIIGRQMHRYTDGLNHQGAIAVVFDSDTLEVIKNWGQTSGHSFESVLTTNSKGEFVGIDLGDNYPRGVHLHKFTSEQSYSQVVYTFKTQHGTAPNSPAGVTYPFYSEISSGNTAYYQWSNDNRTYTELGGVIGTTNGYTVVFAGEATPDGRALDNARVGNHLNDPRNIGLIQVKMDFENFAGASSNEVTDDLVKTRGVTETGGFYTFGGQWSKQRNTGVVWLTHYQDKDQANVSRLKTVKLNNDNLLLLWEKWSPEHYINTYAKVVDEVGNTVIEEVELGTQVRLNRRDDIWKFGSEIYLVAADQPEKKLELIVLKLK